MARAKFEAKPQTNRMTVCLFVFSSALCRLFVFSSTLCHLFIFLFFVWLFVVCLPFRQHFLVCLSLFVFVSTHCRGGGSGGFCWSGGSCESDMLGGSGGSSGFC